jgi:hypothetical protein
MGTKEMVCYSYPTHTVSMLILIFCVLDRIHMFDNVDVAVFITSLNEFDLNLFEDDNTKRMHESIHLFDEVTLPCFPCPSPKLISYYLLMPHPTVSE